MLGMRFLTKTIFWIVLILVFNYVYSMGIHQSHHRNHYQQRRPPHQPQVHSQRLYQPRSHQGYRRPHQDYQRPLQDHQRPLQDQQRPQVQNQGHQRPHQSYQRPTQGHQRPHQNIIRPQAQNKGHQRPQRPHRPKKVTDDLFGRGRIHPSNIPRFRKYFQQVSMEQLDQGPRGSAATRPSIPDHHHYHQNNHHRGYHVHETETAIKDHGKFKNVPNMKDHDEQSPDLSGCDGLVPNHEIEGQKYIVVPENQFHICPPMKWAEASDFCQSKSMGLVTLGQSVDRNTAQQILNISQVFDIPGFWTGGYVTHPVVDQVLNTIIWSSMETEIIDPGEGYFSKTGEAGIGQPDNYAFRLKGGLYSAPEEHCVAALNNRYNDGQVLHDLLCDIQLPVVCKEMDFGFMSNDQFQ